MTTIPAELYPQSVNTEDISTFGVQATLITSADMSEDVVYAVVKEVFENLESFKALHPAYEHITPSSMLEGLSAPLHSGAVRYYREAGLLDSVDKGAAC